MTSQSYAIVLKIYNTTGSGISNDLVQGSGHIPEVNPEEIKHRERSRGFGKYFVLLVKGIKLQKCATLGLPELFAS
jgi:hypothetical protein